MVQAGVCREEADRIVHAHCEHVGDARLPPADGESLGVEAPSPADVAQNLDVRQEAHLDGLYPLAFARLAAAARGIEREAAGGVAADARLRRAGVDAADLVPEADVGRGAGARGLADGRLIHLENPVEVLDTEHRIAADELAGRAAALVAA